MSRPGDSCLAGCFLFLSPVYACQGHRNDPVTAGLPCVRVGITESYDEAFPAQSYFIYLSAVSVLCSLLPGVARRTVLGAAKREQ